MYVWCIWCTPVADSSDSDGEGDGGEEELQAELAELGGGGDEYAPVGEEENVGWRRGGGRFWTGRELRKKVSHMHPVHPHY